MNELFLISKNDVFNEINYRVKNLKLLKSGNSFWRIFDEYFKKKKHRHLHKGIQFHSSKYFTTAAFQAHIIWRSAANWNRGLNIQSIYNNICSVILFNSIQVSDECGVILRLIVFPCDSTAHFVQMM